MNYRALILSLSSGVLAAGSLALGCSPAVESGECAAGTPCPRGNECNVAEAICVPLDLPTNATESPAEASFTNKAVPFFRGRVCTVSETRAGEPFPVFVDPCLHPCLDVNRFEFKHSWTCSGSDCEAWAVMWVNADAASACPEDAFGNFPAGQCEYGTPVEFTINPVFDDGTVIQGSMELEIPFLSNADAEAIAASGGSQAKIEERIAQYPEDASRFVGAGPISILDAHAPPPVTCGENGGGCECFNVGL